MKTSSLLWIPVLTSLTGSACVEAKKEKVQKPNVLLIYADDIGYGDLSCNGGQAIKTPNVEKLASEGIRFTNVHCGAATSTPPVMPC